MYARAGDRRKRKSYKYILTSIFVIILSFIFTAGIIRWQTAKSEEQGNKVIKAIENYHAIKSKYPSSLDDLIPQFMYPVPYSYMGYGNVPFGYNLKNGGNNYTLSFPNAAIFNTTYDSEVRNWITE